MFQWVILIATVIGSNIFALIYKGRQREVVMPLSFLFTLLTLAVLPSIGGPFHTVYIFLKFVVWMLALNGFPRCDMCNNPSLKAFLFFYLYMYGIGFTGLYVLEMSSQYIQVLLTAFGVGYFLASWALRTEKGMSRLLTAATVAGAITVLQRLVSGGMSAALLDESGRAMEYNEATGQFESSTGVNGYALNMMTLLPFVLLVVIEPLGIRCKKWVKWTAIGASVGIMLLAIRTGSRNGCLGLLPCAWYVLHSSANMHVRMKRIVLALVVGAFVAIAVLFSMGGVDSIRAFNFSTKNDSATYSTAGDALTSGRFSLYERIYDQMDFGQRLYGAGYGTAEAANFVSKNVAAGDREYVLAHRTRVGVGNMHSMYMSIFFRTGLIGSFLFLVFLITSWKTMGMLGARGKMAGMFLGVWLITGLGESAGITSYNTSLLAGFGMGLLNLKNVVNSEFLEMRGSRYGYPIYRA